MVRTEEASDLVGRKDGKVVAVCGGGWPTKHRELWLDSAQRHGLVVEEVPLGTAAGMMPRTRPGRSR